jgi:hypothetical protein
MEKTNGATSNSFKPLNTHNIMASNYNHPKVFTAVEVCDKIMVCLKQFEVARKQGVHKQIKEINNVDFHEFFRVFASMTRVYGDKKVRLYMPGEMANEGMMILFLPTIGQTIAIESTPCVDMQWKVRQIDFKQYVN